MGQTHGRYAAPYQVFLFLAERCMIDSQFFVPGWHGVGAEYVDFELIDEALQQGLAFMPFEVDGNGLLADIGRHEIAMAILPCHRPADVTVGIAFGLSTWDWSGFQLDHTPAKVDEAKGRIGQSQGLFHTEYGSRFQDAKFIT
jgi:hypothetical protein